MKKLYVKPEMNSETFAANEYVAACYKISCNVPTYGFPYIEGNGQKGYQNDSEDIPLGNNTKDGIASTVFSVYKGCGYAHGVKGVNSAVPEANAMFQPYDTSEWPWEPVGDPYPVYYYEKDIGADHSKYHFCKIDEGNIQWEEKPNAS